MNRKVLRLIKFIIFIIILAGVLGGGYYYLSTHYDIKNVFVEGNVHYTEKEIKEIVQEGPFGNNSLYLSYKYKNRAIKDLPFIEMMDVDVLSPDTVKITVYEKVLAGYIEYLGKYIYFDKDGIVSEVSTVRTEGIPEVIGVEFDYVVLHEQLPAENTDLFKSVLDMTQLMSKYGVDAQKIYFKDGGSIVLYQGDIIVKLGTQENIDIKVMNLPGILEKLKGEKGVLRMENYSEGTKKTTFERDKD
ncbi:MAG: FtsQ-type POTRA domain-containing protein [Lachnospiraceae bacterium]|nr:FtsQ-type POTRA domain-containing protein [Lachnospiraceae bacterium]